MGSPWDQSSYAARLGWGARGAREVVPGCAVAVIVDVLSFTTCVTVAAERGIIVRPFPWRDHRAAEAAEQAGALLAVPRQNATSESAAVSLSPASIARAPKGMRIVLPSPNGSTIARELEAAGDGGDTRATVVAASLRNAGAVGRWLGGREGPVAVIAAGERWTDDGSLRVAVEDLWGAGAVLHALAAADPGRAASPEAEVARAAYAAVAGRIGAALAACASGRELRERGFGADVEMAAEVDVTDVVPVLRDRWFDAGQ